MESNRKWILNNLICIFSCWTFHQRSPGWSHCWHNVWHSSRIYYQQTGWTARFGCPATGWRGWSRRAAHWTAVEHCRLSAQQINRMPLFCVPSVWLWFLLKIEKIRMIAAVRFAPHLEKCIGIGRNSRFCFLYCLKLKIFCRARRRGNNPSSSHENATIVRATRSATLRSATKANNFDGFALEHPMASSGMHFAAEEQDKMKEEMEGEEESMKDRLRNKQQQNNGTTTTNRHPNWRIVKR